MIGKRSILAIICARGGSKGLPGKNIRPLAGKPLIGWTIEAVQGSKYVDAIQLSTDSDEIAEVSKEFGLTTSYRRPAPLASDTARDEDALLDAMEWHARHHRKHDYVMWISPTNPLRDARLIDQVVDYLVNLKEARAVLTVTRCNRHPMSAGPLPPNLSMKEFTRFGLANRQELPPYYEICDAVGLIEWDYFLEVRELLTPFTFAFLTQDREGFDINSLIDFRMAELLMAEPGLM